jgi:hypothetical protein
MKKKIATVFISALFILSLFSPLKVVNAQLNACDFFPCEQTGVDDEDETAAISSTGSFIRFVTSIIFVGLILMGVGIIIKAALTIIRSQGDESKVQEGAKAIKAVFTGVLMLMLGLIGLLIFGYLFNSTGIFKEQVEAPPGVNVPRI